MEPCPANPNSYIREDDNEQKEKAGMLQLGERKCCM